MPQNDPEKQNAEPIEYICQLYRALLKTISIYVVTDIDWDPDAYRSRTPPQLGALIRSRPQADQR
jgi:hypothetical protein